MGPRRIFFLLCLMGLSLATTNYSNAQTRVYANVAAGNSADFNAVSLSVDLNPSDYSYITSANILSSSYLDVKFPVSGKSGDAITVQIQSEGVLNAALLNSITLKLYDSLGVNVATVGGSSVLQLFLLSEEAHIYGVRFLTDINANYTFKEVRIELNNLLSVNVLNEFRIYGVFFDPSCPPIKANSLINYGTNTLLTGFVTNPTNVVDASVSTYATMICPLDLLALLPPAYITVGFSAPASPGEFVGFTVSQSSTLLSLALLNNISITAYDATNNQVAFKSGFTLLDLKLLGGSTGMYTLGFVAPAGSYTISRLKINMTGAIGVLESINVHNAFHYRIEAAPVAISANGPLTFCNDSSVVLTAEASTTGNTFLWSNGATTPSITANASGNYSVKVTDASGCTSSSIPVAVTEYAAINATVSATNVKCHGEANGSAAITVQSSGSHVCEWNTGSTDFTLADLSPANYTAKITNTTTGCSANFSALVKEPAPLTLTASAVDESCVGNDAKIVLLPSGGTAPYQYSRPVESNEVVGLKAGTYHIMITDSKSCTNSVTKVVKKANCSTAINIHNVITPNNDGINDELVIEGIEKYPASALMVFDKWGDMVYDQGNYSNNWRGVSKSESSDLPAGTYFYILKLNAPEVPDGKNDYTGFILIQR